MKKIIILLLFISINLISKDFYYSQNEKVDLIESEYFLTIKSDKKIPLELFDEISEIKEYKRGVGEYLILKFNKKINKNIKESIKNALKNNNFKFLKTYKVFDDKLWPKFYDKGLFIKFKDSVSQEQVNEFIKKYNLKNKSSYKHFKGLYFFETDLDSLSLANEIYETGLVEYSATDFYYKFHTDFVPNDQYFSQQWHHGSSYGGINSVAAWDINKGSDVKIAIFDSGVSYHPDLRLVGSINLTDEPIGAGRSGNHGTHCAGISAARGNNFIGVTGVCMNCKILSAKTLIIDGDNYDYTTNKVYTDAFHWAMINNADVVNNSWGYDGDNTEPVPSYYNTIFSNATSNGRDGKGIVIVFSAGNDSMPILNGTLKSHPLVITVGAVDYLDRRSCYSDYGLGLDVVAPSSSGFSGDGFLDNRTWTTDPIALNNGYNIRGLAYKYIDGEAVNRTLGGENLEDVDTRGEYTRFFGGTSSAAPLVSGLSALIISENPDLTYSRIRSIITSTADKVDAQSSSSCNLGEECNFSNYDANGHSICAGYGKINAYRALLKASIAQTCTPSHLYERYCNNDKDDDCDGLVDDMDMDCQNLDKCERRICPDRETCYTLSSNSLRTACDCSQGYRELANNCIPDVCSSRFVSNNCGEDAEFMHCELARNEFNDMVPSCFCNENYISIADTCTFDCSSDENSIVNINNNACICKESYKLNNAMNKCIFDCSHLEFSDVNEANNACICKENYNLFEGKCIFDCSGMENSHVNDDNNACNCNEGYIFNNTLNKCVFDCSYLEHSSVNLSNDACICNENYNFINDKCIFDCSKDENSHVNSANHACECNNGYIYSPEDSKCIKNEVYLCQLKDCGENSECFVSILNESKPEARCICDDGYEIDELVIDTTKNKCTKIIEEDNDKKEEKPEVKVNTKTEASSCSYSQKDSSFVYFILFLMILFIKQRKTIIK